ncbi:DoxX family protein [candidate division KSB1 bacterium]|nr:DoxX family protein [candidate division KSB1 bacterium]
MNNYIFLAGRILYALPLIIMGSNHFLYMPAMVSYATVKGVPLPQASVILSGLVLVLGAISVLVGFRGKIGAWLVTAFLLATAFVMHRFWGVSDAMAAEVETANFFKNFIMAGAALMITQTGTGPYSVDNLNKPQP